MYNGLVHQLILNVKLSCKFDGYCVLKSMVPTDKFLNIMRWNF